jgi:hypothetical protein
MNPMTDFDPNIKIRMLTSGDRTSLAALPERVTLASSYARFHGGLSAMPFSYAAVISRVAGPG